MNGRGEEQPPGKQVRNPATRTDFPEAWGRIRQGRFCQKCDAWLGCLGLEPRFEMYVAHVADIFDEVRRVLRPDGTLWLNLGDCYHNGDKGGYERDRVKATDSLQAGHLASNFAGQPNRMQQPGLKPKDLVGIAWRVAFALQARGWWLRSDIIWAKPNPMPESVRDRPTRAHEYIFLFSKSERYFYDDTAIREPVAAPGRRSGNKKRRFADGGRGRLNTHLGSSVPWRDDSTGRNARSVWTIPVQPFKGAHFATFPERLAERCILAGTSGPGACSRCGAPFRRVTSRRPAGGRGSGNTTRFVAIAGDRARLNSHLGSSVPWRPTIAQTHAWSAPCNCWAPTSPCIVLDPFAGSGTTGVVAARLGRRFIGIEMNNDYRRMARRRIATALADR